MAAVRTTPSAASDASSRRTWIDRAMQRQRSTHHATHREPPASRMISPQLGLNSCRVGLGPPDLRVSWRAARPDGDRPVPCTQGSSPNSPRWPATESITRSSLSGISASSAAQSRGGKNMSSEIGITNVFARMRPSAAARSPSEDRVVFGLAQLAVGSVSELRPAQRRTLLEDEVAQIEQLVGALSVLRVERVVDHRLSCRRPPGASTLLDGLAPDKRARPAWRAPPRQDPPRTTRRTSR